MNFQWICIFELDIEQILINWKMVCFVSPIKYDFWDQILINWKIVHFVCIM